MWSNVAKTNIVGTTYTLTGCSVAARNTCLYIKELNIMIDAGMSSDFQVDSIFITHCHGDHTFDLPRLIITASDKKPTIYVPSPSKDSITTFVKTALVMSTTQTDPRIIENIKIVPMNIVDKLDMTIKNDKWQIETFKCHHSVPSIGYGFTQFRNRLKEEYQGMDKEKLNELAKQKVQLSELKPFPLFCVLGDTTHKVFNDLGIFKYKTIIVECTFLLETEKTKAKKDKHMHWDNLEPIIISHPDNHFILIHFSQKYTKKDIKDFFETKTIPNITLFI